MATMKTVRLVRPISGLGREGTEIELSRWSADALVSRGDAKYVVTAPPPAPPKEVKRKGGPSPEDAASSGTGKGRRKADKTAEPPKTETEPPATAEG